MKKQFKRLIPFLLAALIAWPAWALTIQGGNGSAIQDGNATIQGSRWTPLKLSNLVAWYDASSQANFTFNGPGVNKADLDFSDTSVPSGWTETGSPSFDGVEMTNVIVTGDESFIVRSSGGGDTTVWAEAKIKLDAGAVISTSTGENLFIKGTLSGLSRFRIGFIDDGGVIKFAVRYAEDAGATNEIVDSPLVTLGAYQTITIQWESETTSSSADGIMRVWIDKVLAFEDLTVENNATPGINRFEVGNKTTASSSSYTTHIDDFKWGTSGASPAQISQWNDLSNNGNDLIQATAVDQPEYNPSEPKVTFDGVSEFLSAVDSASLDMTDDFTFFVVANITAGSGNRKMLQKGRGNEQYSFFLGTTDLLRILVNDGSVETINSTSAVTEGSNVVLSLSYISGGAVAFFEDGGSLGTGTSTQTGIQNSSQTLDVGVGFNGNTEFFTGDIFEIIMVARSLSIAEHNQGGNYLANKYGLTWTEIP